VKNGIQIKIIKLILDFQKKKRQEIKNKATMNKGDK
jgi:hypothetical protein